MTTSSLANVSVYEFINDHLRPELAWHIFSYVADDKHKEGVIRSQSQRRIYTQKSVTLSRKVNGVTHTETTIKGQKWRWAKYDKDKPHTYPYNKLPLYREISLLGLLWQRQRGERFVKWCSPKWYNNYKHGVLYNGWGLRLTHTNKLLHELWSYAMANGKKYVVAKKDLIELCKTNKLKGYTKYFGKDKRGGGGWLLTTNRQPLITALIKMA
jgi:hypothetical protein